MQSGSAVAQGQFQNVLELSSLSIDTCDHLHMLQEVKQASSSSFHSVSITDLIYSGMLNPELMQLREEIISLI